MHAQDYREDVDIIEFSEFIGTAQLAALDTFLNGNLYIIELDEEKADPYYLAAFFGSEQGTAALRSITVGATIPNIGVEQLTKLVIPIPPLEKQKEIADKYKTVKDEITMLQLKLEKAKNRMAHIIE